MFSKRPSFSLLLFVSMGLLPFGKMKLPDVASFFEGENGPRFFSDILGRYFTGVAAETTTAIFPATRN